MASNQVEIIATLVPKQGKHERAIELLRGMAVWVEANEPDTLRYTLHVEADKKSGKVQLIMLETYKDMAAVKAHGSTAEFKAFGKKVADEGLLEGPMKLQFVKKEAGFDRGSKL